MLKIIRFPFLILISLQFLATAQDRQQYHITWDGKEVYVSLRLPDDYNHQKTYPLLLGPGDGKSDENPSYFWRSNLSESQWILAESPCFFGDHATDKTAAIIKLLVEKFNVEGQQAHLVGFSANSGKIFSAGLALPQLVHSITGIPGHPRRLEQISTTALKEIEFQFIVGENDQYWLGEAQRAHQFLLKKGAISRLQVVENGPHVLTELIGDPFLKIMGDMRDQ